MTDLIFWYTGWIVWAIFALVVLFFYIYAAIRIYRHAKNWDRLVQYFMMPKDDRLALHAACDFPEGAKAWFGQFQSQIKRLVKTRHKLNLNKFLADYPDYDGSSCVKYDGAVCSIIGSSTTQYGKYRIYRLQVAEAGGVYKVGDRIHNVLACDMEPHKGDW